VSPRAFYNAVWHPVREPLPGRPAFAGAGSGWIHRV